MKSLLSSIFQDWRPAQFLRLRLVVARRRVVLVQHPGPQPLDHVVAQRLWLEDDGIGAVSRDFAGQSVARTHVDLDDLARAPTQDVRARWDAGAAERGGAVIGHPHPRGHPGGRIADHPGDQLAQIHALGPGDRTRRSGRGHVGRDAGQPERTGVVAVAIVPVGFGEPFAPWLYRGLVLLVLGCPCSLVISTPVTIVAAIAAMVAAEGAR